GIAESLYYSWSKEFLEAGKQRLAGDTQASIRQSRLAWRSGPVPIKTSHQRAQPRRLRVSLFALIAVEPASTAAQPIFGKKLKRQTFLNASRFG
ncbi:MAG: hypothetical protein EBT13_15175, partial [Rhodobacteraceae bacterium]|nr:hypothetical protein [Paracoccaceae bacterium]